LLKQNASMGKVKQIYNRSMLSDYADEGERRFRKTAIATLGIHPGGRRNQKRVDESGATMPSLCRKFGSRTKAIAAIHSEI